MLGQFFGRVSAKAQGSLVSRLCLAKRHEGPLAPSLVKIINIIIIVIISLGLVGELNNPPVFSFHFPLQNSLTLLSRP